MHDWRVQIQMNCVLLPLKKIKLVYKVQVTPPAIPPTLFMNKPEIGE